jgi:hypothetical protein
LKQNYFDENVGMKQQLPQKFGFGIKKIISFSTKTNEVLTNFQLTTLYELLTNFLGPSHEVHARLKPEFLQMITHLLWALKECSITFLKVLANFLKFSYELLMDFLQTYELFINFLWTSYDHLMNFLWTFNKYFINFFKDS